MESWTTERYLTLKKKVTRITAGIECHVLLSIIIKMQYTSSRYQTVNLKYNHFCEHEKVSDVHSHSTHKNMEHKHDI